MTKKLNKRGFTIVELVVVIVVIAILAAVLIPTISNLISKANRSADIQAVYQMNTQLATYVDGSIKNVADAVKVLAEVNIDLENYKPLQKGHYFYFVLDSNNVGTIIYTDAEGEIVYPTNVTIPSNAQWMSLSGEVPTDSDYTITNNEVTINSGAKLTHLIGAKQNTTENLTVKLSGNVDLKGAAVDFGQTQGNITIQGSGSNATDTTLSGIRADDNAISPTSGEYAGHTYGYGLFGNVQSGTVTIENLTISNLVVGNSNATHEEGANTIGLIAGYISSGAKVVLNNVTFKNCVVNGYQKVGGIVGQLHGTLEMTNVKFENCEVNGAVEVAKVAGIVSDSGNLSTTNCDFNGITAAALESDIGGFIAKDDIQYSLVGDSENVFGYWNEHYSGHDNVVIFGIVTNDLAWYHVATTNETETVIANGSNYSLNAWVNSTSNDIENGVPKNN